MLIQRKRIPILSMITLGLLPSFLKIIYYRMRGLHIGKGVHISFGSVLMGKRVEIGEKTSIGFATIIRGQEIRMGRNVDIGSMVFIDVRKINIDDDVLIREQVLIGGLETPDSSLSIGKRSHIRQMCNINTSKPVNIGYDTAIGGHSLIFTHSSWQSILEGYPCTFAPVTIGNNVSVSWDVFILPGVTIGNDALVSAGSVVTRKIPEKSIASGNPANVIIPSGYFPSHVALSERDSIMRKILEEFWRYLRQYNFEVQIKTATPHLAVRIMRRKRSFFFSKNLSFDFIYISEKTRDLESLAMNDSTVYLSLETIENSFRIKLLKHGCIWADLASRQRGGTNDFVEELLSFLLRFGIRFERTDR